MLTRFKKKLAEIKTDLNHKIDQFEVDKNYVLHKTQRQIQTSLTNSGINYLKKKDQTIKEIQETSRGIENDSQIFEKQVKEVALVHTTNLFYTFRTLEKELQLVVKSIEYTKNAIERIQNFCFKLNYDLMALEDIYSELENGKQIEKSKEKYFI
ncbi:hypothetical protein BpHYR1_051392 [Brachionus plicatilis]|uniref:Uncharacterized protein n=1 Tax=Brachionus plicatilis TaxID=10195 RepID=A0A3M7S2H5_BRAPC|nr:hypothetical protein BpHYR1_051392 [Brachionus plicatilis]